jgi:hypothetical protein
LLPSYLKNFSDSPDLLSVWEKAFAALKESEEIVIIGYSLPKEDSAATLLLGTTGISKKKLTIVDPSASQLVFEKFCPLNGNQRF